MELLKKLLQFRSFSSLLLIFTFFLSQFLSSHQDPNNPPPTTSPIVTTAAAVGAAISRRKITHNILEGTDNGCFQPFYYYVNPNIQFHLCLSQSKEYQKNGRSITELIKGRGYMPTCRVLHLLLWMLEQVDDPNAATKDSYFIDVGANIGACTMHIGALGLNVISIEPIPEHVAIIQGSLTMNPTYKVDLRLGGVSSTNRKMKAQLFQEAKNWGRSELTEASGNDTVDLEVDLYSLDSLSKGKHVALVKIDCEGCEYEALLGAKKLLNYVPILKIELMSPTYRNGNATATAGDIVQLLDHHDYVLYHEPWHEGPFYHGLKKNSIFDIDRIFGSARFQLPIDVPKLHESATLILKDVINAKLFKHRKFVRKSMDLIAIKKSVSEKMLDKWLKE